MGGAMNEPRWRERVVLHAWERLGLLLVLLYTLSTWISQPVLGTLRAMVAPPCMVVSATTTGYGHSSDGDSDGDHAYVTLAYGAAGRRVTRQSGGEAWLTDDRLLAVLRPARPLRVQVCFELAGPAMREIRAGGVTGSVLREGG